MHQHNSLLVQQFFQSEDLFQLVVSINKIIEELWMLRKENPMQLQEWKTKHKQILKFRSPILNCLERQFGHGWVKNLMERAEVEKLEREGFGDQE